MQTEIQPAIIEEVDVEAKKSYLDVITIVVPLTTKWKPNAVLQLTKQLTLLSSVDLSIEASANQITWSIQVPYSDTNKIVSALHSFYPQAHLEVKPKQASHIGYHLYHLQTGAVFFLPLKYIRESKDLDPLVPVVGAMANLAEDEAIIYELSLRRPGQDYQALGEKLISKILRPTAGQIILDIAARATAQSLSKGAYIPPRRQTLEEKHQEKEALKYIDIAREKINLRLIEVVLGIKIKASSSERVTDLVNTLYNATTSLDGADSVLVFAGTDTYPLILSPPEIATLWHLPTDQMQTPGIVWAPSAVAPIPRELIQQNQGVTLGDNVFQGRSHPVRLPYEDRVTHVNLVGRTRVGKSTLLHRMIHQDIADSKGVAVIDPHGDLIDAILATSIPKKREQEVVLFDTRDHDYPIGMNLLTTLPDVNQEDTASYALTVMRKMFADQWSSGSRMEVVLDAALRALVTVEGTTIRDVPRLLVDPKYRRGVLKHVTNRSTLDFWYDEYEIESPSQQREFARPINHRIRRFYANPTIERIICQRDSLDFRHILDQNQIFLANLGGVSEVEGETLGALLISKIQMAAMSRGDIPPEQRILYYLYVDEVQNFIATSLSKVFSEAGKYGLSLTVANQYLKQLEGNTLESLMGNVGTTLIFRVGPQDARALAPFVKPQFVPEDLTNLDRFAAVVKMQLAGETLPAFSMITRRPLKKSGKANERVERIRQHSRMTYGRPKDEVDAELMSRYEQRTSDEGDEAEGSYFD